MSRRLCRKWVERARRGGVYVLSDRVMFPWLVDVLKRSATGVPSSTALILLWILSTLALQQIASSAR